MDLARWVYQTDRLYQGTIEDLFSHRKMMDYLYHENIYIRREGLMTEHVYLTEAEAQELAGILDTFAECYRRQISAREAGYTGEHLTPDLSEIDGLAGRVARALEDHRDRGVSWLWQLDATVDVEHVNSASLPMPRIRGVGIIPFLVIAQWEGVLQLGAILLEADPDLEACLGGFGIHLLQVEEQMNITQTVREYLRAMRESRARVGASEELRFTREFMHDYEKNRVIWCRYMDPMLAESLGGGHPSESLRARPPSGSRRDQTPGLPWGLTPRPTPRPSSRRSTSASRSWTDRPHPSSSVALLRHDRPR